MEHQTSGHNCTVLRGYVTTADLCRMFSRAPLTILKWRQNKGLPYVRIPGDGKDTVRYKLVDVLDWAKKTKRRIRVNGHGDEND